MKQLLATGGAEIQQPDPGPTRSQKGVRRAAWIQLAGVWLTLVVLLFSVAEEEVLNLMVVPILTFIVGFFMLMYSAFFAKGASLKKKTPASTTAGVQALPAVGPRPVLPPQYAQPIQNPVPRQGATAEMVQPPSVTDRTTKLFEEEPRSTK